MSPSPFVADQGLAALAAAFTTLRQAAGEGTIPSLRELAIWPVGDPRQGAAVDETPGATALAEPDLSAPSAALAWPLDSATVSAIMREQVAFWREVVMRCEKVRRRVGVHGSGRAAAARSAQRARLGSKWRGPSRLLAGASSS